MERRQCLTGAQETKDKAGAGVQTAGEEQRRRGRGRRVGAGARWAWLHAGRSRGALQVLRGALLREVVIWGSFTGYLINKHLLQERRLVSGQEEANLGAEYKTRRLV